VRASYTFSGDDASTPMRCRMSTIVPTSFPVGLLLPR
jgi:hypothetical protein